MSSGTLLDLAWDYESEAAGLLVWQRDRRALLESARLFRRMVCNREAVDPGRIAITWTMLIDIPQRWCHQHGYRAVAGHGGYVIQRGDEAMIIAGPGDTLRWDGQRITVEREP
ncbi:hypothetical protein CW362_09025 [Streptomyces populi]|uniref:Uncharacterized protein n=1 Tax=Streptomyces populi TaxID=2058924 RepID=A0A2I0STN7_9ACTN|nr:hypothetical protein [Streptomyces populi]PKT73275.1 hypothetical protein CW362_09025 [Streptomyces populi]